MKGGLTLTTSVTCWVMVALQALSMIVLLVLLYGTLTWNRKRDEKAKFYLACLICNLLALCADIFTWLYDGVPEKNGLVSVLIIVAVTFNYILTSVFIFYVSSVIREKVDFSWKYPRNIACFNLLIVIAIFILTAMGKVLSVVNGQIVLGDWYTPASLGCVVSIIFSIIIVFKYSQSLGGKTTAALLSYCFLPVFAAILTLFGSKLELGYMSATIAFLIVYVVIQSGRVSELELRTKLLTELSRTDSLTGLNSRTHFNELLESWDNSPKGIVFCDLNFLKVVNDSVSHQAGDELLKTLADILRANFSQEELFRLSGDEFLVVSNKDEKTFSDSVEKLRKDLHNNGELAAVGAVYSRNGHVEKLIAEAEKLMYEDKIKFHEAHPEYLLR